MAVAYKDYYQILGVPRAATAEEIRKAFRQLAREFHPDVARDKVSAEIKFKEINEAYEVLGDTERRARYDSLGEHWKGGNEFRASSAGWNQARDAGNGRTFRGTNFEFQYGGSGFSEFFEQIFGAARDLYLRVRVEKHPQFRVQGADLYCELHLAPWEAVLGANVSLATLEGRLDVKVPPGSQPGHRLRLRGHGLPIVNGERGDLIAVLRIRIPQTLEPHERALWGKLARESRFRARE